MTLKADTEEKGRDKPHLSFSNIFSMPKKEGEIAYKKRIAEQEDDAFSEKLMLCQSINQRERYALAIKSLRLKRNALIPEKLSYKQFGEFFYTTQTSKAALEKIISSKAYLSLYQRERIYIKLYKYLDKKIKGLWAKIKNDEMAEKANAGYHEWVYENKP